jgi:hypothetical protein
MDEKFLEQFYEAVVLPRYAQVVYTLYREIER